MIRNGTRLLAKGGKLSSTLPTKVIDIFNGVLHDSITYSYGVRNPGGIFEFDFWGTTLDLKASNNLGSSFPIEIYVDGAYNQSITITNGDTSTHTVTFSEGKKRIRIIEGICDKPSITINGCRISNITLDSFKFAKFQEGTISERLVILGDSISNGAGATNPMREGWSWLLRHEDNKNVSVIGYGWGKLKDIAQTTPLITTTTGWLTSLFSNVSTIKKVIMFLGTNDAAIDITSSTTYSGWLANLLDAIHTLDSNIKIFCISPLNRSNYDSLSLDNYANAINSLCSSRSSYCTYIYGKSILVSGDLSDGLHPTTIGHKKLKDYLTSIILS